MKSLIWGVLSIVENDKHYTNRTNISLLYLVPIPRTKQLTNTAIQIMFESRLVKIEN